MHLYKCKKITSLRQIAAGAVAVVVDLSLLSLLSTLYRMFDTCITAD